MLPMVGGGWGGRQEEGMPFPSGLCDASPNTGALAMPILQRANTARGAQRAASESQFQPEPSPLGLQLFAGDLMDPLLTGSSQRHSCSPKSFLSASF